MGVQTNSLEALVRTLPTEAQKEVRDFVEFLLEKQAHKPRKRRAAKSGGPLRQDWAGMLSEYRDQYTSRELQQKALEWRGD